MNTYKKGCKYVKRNKAYLFIMIVFLIVFQLFNSISPLIVQDILDDKLLGITGVWYQDEEGYQVANVKISREEKNGEKPYTISYIDDAFYINEGLVKEGVRQKIGDEMVVGVTRYPITKLTDEEKQLIFETQRTGLNSDLIFLVIVLLISIVASYTQRIGGALLTINTTRDIRIDALSKIEYIDINDIESEPVGKMANRVLSDAVGVSSLYTSTVNIFISSLLAIIFSLIGMYILSPKMTLICLLLIPIMFFWIRKFTKQINSIAEKVNETNSQIIGRMNEIINGISILKIFNSEDMTINNFRKLNEQYVDEKLEEVDLHLTKGWNGINLFQGLSVALVIGLLAFINLKQIAFIQAGLIYAFYNYICKIIAPLNLLFHEFSNLEHSKIKTERVFKVLESDLEDQTLKSIPPYKGDIKFEDVTFSYNEGKKALDKINIDIKAGQKVGFVGRSGSGKSTIINLLMRFNELKESDSGIISIDGCQIETLSKRTYRSHLGIILQEPILFKGTLASNIKFGKEIEESEIIKTLELIGAKGILEKFNYDINSPISNAGVNLSLGEKQLISLARVLIRDPSILIMDEATANIDTETESMISYALSVVAKNRTVIIVAHRLSTIRDADQIIMLEDGKIIESGTHNQLLAYGGKYMEMYKSQTHTS